MRYFMKELDLDEKSMRSFQAICVGMEESGCAVGVIDIDAESKVN